MLLDLFHTDQHILHRFLEHLFDFRLHISQFFAQIFVNFDRIDYTIVRLSSSAPERRYVSLVQHLAVSNIY